MISNFSVTPHSSSQLQVALPSSWFSLFASYLAMVMMIFVHGDNGFVGLALGY